ncbi:hypothetical protein D3C86_1403170 [compost metagenome]
MARLCFLLGFLLQFPCFVLGQRAGFHAIGFDHLRAIGHVRALAFGYQRFLPFVIATIEQLVSGICIRTVLGLVLADHVAVAVDDLDVYRVRFLGAHDPRTIRASLAHCVDVKGVDVVLLGDQAVKVRAATDVPFECGYHVPCVHRGIGQGLVNASGVLANMHRAGEGCVLLDFAGQPRGFATPFVHMRLQRLAGLVEGYGGGDYLLAGL